MTKHEVKKGVRVVFRGPAGGLAPVYNPESHRLMGRVGAIVYGVSEDVWCYPDDLSADMVWVSFDGDRLPRGQVSAAWLEMAL